MGKKFSPSTRGFYIVGVHANIPPDAIDITDQEHADLLAGELAESCIGDGAGGKPVQIDRPPPSRAQLCSAIDAEADAARLAVVGDPLRVVEYERAAAEATAYQGTGYSGPVPAAVQSWADAKGWSGQQAADDILAAASAFNAALYQLRDIRLKGKAAVMNSGADAAAKTIADAAIAQIRAAVTGLA